MKGLHRRGSKAASAFVCASLLVFASFSEARIDRTTTKPYYGQVFYENLSSKSSYPELKEDLYIILKSAHNLNEGDFDSIDSSCKSNECVRHTDLGYKNGRRYLFGKIHLGSDGDRYWVNDVYCGETYSSDNFPRGQGPGPMQIPNHQVVNAEHTWPQSKFSHSENRSMQKSDLHNLYPTNSKANSERGNFPFGEVDEVSKSECPGTALGYVRSGGGEFYYEPPDVHKGNVARSMFYFATRYNMKISSLQEGFLRRWHKLDPIDQEETDRNELVYEIQQVRNPYIDHPELVDMVSDF